MITISLMVSSTLSNSCFEVKHAVMKRYASGIGNGSVESLKMLYVYSKYENWSLDNIKYHQQFSMELLKASYKQDSNIWNELEKLP